jgi:hypothetical protein
MSSQSIGCSRGERLRRGGRCAGKLHSILVGIFANTKGFRTQWLLLQHQENRINQFEVFRKVVQLVAVSKSSSA